MRQTLTADTSSIVDDNGIPDGAFSYQWLRVDNDISTEISGATGSDYTLKPDDEGKQVKVRVTFTDDAGNPESLESATVVIPAGGDLTADAASLTFTSTDWDSPKDVDVTAGEDDDAERLCVLWGRHDVLGRHSCTRHAVRVQGV